MEGTSGWDGWRKRLLSWEQRKCLLIVVATATAVCLVVLEGVSDLFLDGKMTVPLEMALGKPLKVLIRGDDRWG